MKRECMCGMVLLGVVALGCSGSWEPDYSKVGLVEVNGRMTLDGDPLANATVIFECPDKTYSFGETDASGNYRLMFDSEKSGVLPGPKIVRVRSGPAGEAAAEVEGSDGKVGKPSKEPIPPCYGSQSKLAVTVAEGRSQTINFDLKSDCSVTGPSS